MGEDEGEGVFSRSISELISLLRTSFRMKEFDEVDEIFVSRELRLKEELENKKKENELLRNEKAIIKAELKEVREKVEELLNLIGEDENEAQNREKREVERREWKTKNRFEQMGTRVSLLETKLPNIINRKTEISKKIEPPPEIFSCATAVIVRENVDSSGSGAVSDVIIHIMDSDDEFPGKAFNGRGNLRVDHGMNVEDVPSIIKRKRAV